MRGGLSVTAACMLHYGDSSGQRVGRSKTHDQLSRALGRWSRYELTVIDELGYVPLAEVGAELLLGVIADRAEKAVIVATNLPFSEWPPVFPSPRLCKAMLDRLTDRAHI